jgi:Protein of unknown function (DUF4238)
MRQPGDPPTFDDHIAQIDPLVPIKVEVNVIIKLIDHEQVGGYINNMFWDVIDVSAASYRLLTSDRPVILAQLKDPNGSVTMPISPTKLFVAVNDPRWIQRVKATKPRDTVARAMSETG